MSIVSFKILFAHWLAFIDALQQFFWNYAPQPLLSTVLPELIEGGSKFSQIVHVPQTGDPSYCSGSVDLATICFVPTILQTPLAMNFSCSVDRPNRDFYDVSSANSSRHHVILDIPVWRPAVPDEDVPSVSPSSPVEDDHTKTNMAPYGARGLSFCPVLVGVVYIQSLLHLYMLLMIPSLCNHWFENVLVYESLNPMELLDCSWLLHTSLWMVSWHLLRNGVRKAVSCLCCVRRVTEKSTHPPIPRIVLIPVDGEAVPVNFMEDRRPNANIGISSSFEAANLKMDGDQDETSDSGERQGLKGSLISAHKSCIATEFKVLPAWTASHQRKHQGGIAEGRNGIGLGSLAHEFVEDSRLLVNQIPNEQLQISFIGTANEPLGSVDEDNLVFPISGSDVLAATRSGCDVNERTGEFEQMVFSEAVVDNVRQDGTDSLGERGVSDREPKSFGPGSLANEPVPDEPGTLSETASATSSFVGSRVMLTPVKNVRFAVGEGARAEDSLEVSWSVSYMDEYTCAWDLESQLGDDGIAPVRIPMVPFDPSMDKQDAVSPEKLTRLAFPVVVSKENDIVLAEDPSPSLTDKPIVNLPSLVTIREDTQFVEMVPMAPVALIEDVATRSPLQIHSLIAPVVLINANYLIEEQGFVPLGTEGLGHGFPRVGHAFGTLDDEASETLDSVPPREDDGSSPYIEGSNSVCSPIVDSEPSLIDTRAPVIASLASATASKITMPAASLVLTNTSPRAAINIPGTNEHEPGLEILYETPRYYANDKDLARSLQNAFRGPEVSIPDVASTGIPFRTISESPNMGGQDDFVNPEKYDNMTFTFTGQPASLSSASAAELSMTKLSERISVLPGTCEEASPLSMISAEKKTRELDRGKSREVDTIPWDHPSTLSKPLPERTLSGSMHAPPEDLLIPKTDSHVNRTSILYETPPSLIHPVSFMKSGEDKGGSSMLTETTYNRRQDLSASIHAPQRTSPEVQSSASQSRDESNRDHRRSVANLVVSETKPVRKPCSPNWTAMPEVVDAFRMFKEGSSANAIRSVSSISEPSSKGPMLGIVGQEGTATSSLNNISATANIQNRWMHGNGLLLVRDLVSSDPADFNLRSCTNLKTPRIYSMNTIPVQQVVYPGMLDVPLYALQHGITPCSVGVSTDCSSMVASSTGIKNQKSSMLVSHHAEIETMLGSRHRTAYRG